MLHARCVSPLFPGHAVEKTAIGNNGQAYSQSLSPLSLLESRSHLAASMVVLAYKPAVSAPKFKSMIINATISC